MQIEGREQELIGIAIVEVVASSPDSPEVSSTGPASADPMPRGFAAVGMSARSLEEVAVAAIDDDARRTGHMGLAIHGGERRDIAEGADRKPRNAGPMGLAAVLDDANAAGVSLADDATHIGGSAVRMHDHDSPRRGREPPML
jgi:hypothetical protein